MRTKRIIIMEAGEPNSNVVKKLHSLAGVQDFEPHLLYWGRGNSAVSYPLASGIPKDRVHLVGMGGSKKSGIAARISVWRECRQLLRKFKPWCVQSSSLDMLLVALVTIRPSGGFVFDLQDSRPWMRRWWIRLFIRAILNQTRLVTVTSPRFESHFLRHYNLISRNQRVICIPNPVDRSRFREYFPRPMDEDIVVGYIGTFRGATAICALADAISLARQMGIPAKAFFAGIGPDQPLVNKLSRNSDFVAYTGPFDQSRDLARLYGQVNMVYAVYDDTEDKKIHWPVRLGEAVFARVPIIVASGSYMAEMIAVHGLGFEVPLGDAKAIVDVLERVSRDRNIIREISENCRRAESLFAFERYEPEFLAAYRGLLDDAG